MLRRFPACLLLLIAMAAGSGVWAESKIYRWTDENGQVHFGGRPPNTQAQQVEVPRHGPSGPQSPGYSPAASRDSAQRMLEMFDRERELRQQRKQQQAQQRQRQQQACDGLRRQWRDLSHPGPIYREDAAGQRRYLDEAQRQAEKDELRKPLSRHCGGAPR